MKEVCVLPIFTPGEITLPTIPRFQYQRTLADEVAAGTMTRDQAFTLLTLMQTIRAFEECIVDMKDGKWAPFDGFKFIGASHLSIGQEAVAAGALSTITKADFITSTHRGHGHGIAKGYFALLEMNTEELLAWMETSGACAEDVDACKIADRDTLLERCIDIHLYKTFAELFGKEEGYCRGRGGGMHIADFHVGHLGANAIVGGSFAIAVGAAMAAEKLGTGQVCISFVGDGAVNNGIGAEAMNFAAMDQFERGCPVIFLIENNQYGMTGQQDKEVTGIDYLAQRAAGFARDAMHAEVVNGMDVLAVRDAIGRAVQLCRDGDGPVLIECETYRYFGHSLSDLRDTYRTKEEEAAWKACDAIQGFAAQMVAAGLATEDECQALLAGVKARVQAAGVKAGTESTDPDPANMLDGLFSPNCCVEAPAEYRTVLEKEPRKVRRDKEGAIFVRQAVAEALIEEMQLDRRVILYGEDVADYGGAFQVTRGILDVFGRERVFNTPISESAIVGTAVGAAAAGMRPVCELMYIDFILMAMDQVGNQAAKNRYMFGGKAELPMVIRTTVGGGKGYAGQHSQSLEAVCTMIPGLKVVAPSTAYDAKGLLKSAIRDNNPVVFIEHQSIYTLRGACPEEEYLVPLGQAAVRREGTDVTIVGYSMPILIAQEAAELAAQEGISCEVIDLRTLIPMDEETVLASLKKTGRLVCVNQAPKTGCFAEHIVARMYEIGFPFFKGPAQIVAAFDCPPPMAATLEAEFQPNTRRVLEGIRAAMGATVRA
ncbi:MAG: Acetoin:2,6-dichlorophenolindophenol oxidoreductase subunit beta [bacterium ADurb.Bin429]|nr:MAG: Acetoin:2,6-dichlorophenolindophenol oxidoreductase subunit beta [bacterium ADurb.Bin429]